MYNFFTNLSTWDIFLIIGITFLGTTLSYVHNPKLKAVLISIPIPFTLAALAVDRVMDCSNLLGLLLLLVYTHSTRFFYQNLKTPIILSILISASGYCIFAALLRPFLPTGEIYFWLTCVIVFLFGIFLHFRHQDIPEPGHRSPLHITIKVLTILFVVITIVYIKQWLKGFITLFPMMGVIGSYEGRNSMWTLCGQMPIIIMTFTPMIAVIRIMQYFYPLNISLIFGWIAFLILFIPLTKNKLQKDRE